MIDIKRSTREQKSLTNSEELQMLVLWLALNHFRPAVSPDLEFWRYTLLPSMTCKGYCHN